MTYLDRIQNFPPILLRLLARHRYGKPLTTDEIVERSGTMPDVCNLLSAPEVEAISKSTNWKGIGVHECLSFQRGCGIQFDDAKAMHRVNDYLKKLPKMKLPFEYLRLSPQWKSYYIPLIVSWRRSYPSDLSNHTHLRPHILALLKRFNKLAA